MANIKLTELTEITALTANDLFYVVDSETSASKKVKASVFRRPYKVYTANLTQSSTDAPVATVLENTLGGTIVWTYDSAGAYVGTLTGAFTENKTALFLSLNSSGGFGTQADLGRTNANAVSITTYNDTGVQADGILTNTTIEIRVYD